MYQTHLTFHFVHTDLVETIESSILGTGSEATTGAEEDWSDYEGLGLRDSRAQTGVPPWTWLANRRSRNRSRSGHTVNTTRSAEGFDPAFYPKVNSAFDSTTHSATGTERGIRSSTKESHKFRHLRAVLFWIAQFLQISHEYIERKRCNNPCGYQWPKRCATASFTDTGECRSGCQDGG